MDETHDPQRRSFLEISDDSDFPIQNLPFGIFSPQQGPNVRPCVGIAIGDQVLDLAVLESAGCFKNNPEFRGLPQIFEQPALNLFLSLGRPAWRATRRIVSHLLSVETPTLRDDLALRQRALLPQSEVQMHLPARIGDYTDFYSSRDHAQNVGTMLRGAENALMPNWLQLPVAYHGRASSVVVSGTPVRRPRGKMKLPNADAPVFGPTRSLDYEFEMGALIGPSNALGEPVPIARAKEHLFGLVLVNDWSARDIQAWEYQPLGPFLAKNFCTSISPWVVTLDALEPFRVAQPAQHPIPLPYLRDPAGDWTFDIQLEALLQIGGRGDLRSIARTNFRHLYWTLRQQLAHHTVNGCNLQSGDLLASGTISGPTPESRGCLLERTWRGSEPLVFPDGTTRTWLEDGDQLKLTGWCEGKGYRVGFGEVSGEVLPALVSD